MEYPLWLCVVWPTQEQNLLDVTTCRRYLWFKTTCHNNKEIWAVIVYSLYVGSDWFCVFQLSPDFVLTNSFVTVHCVSRTQYVGYVLFALFNWSQSLFDNFLVSLSIVFSSIQYVGSFWFTAIKLRSEPVFTIWLFKFELLSINNL